MQGKDRALRERQSPERHASDTTLGTIMKGLSNTYWIVISTKNSKRWIEVSDKKPQVLNTIYNGEIMKVVIGDTRVFIFHQDTFVDSILYEEYWIPHETWTLPLKAKRKPGDSSILLRTAGKKYIYIDGHEIIEIYIDQKVDDFYSPMGNNFVPYPYIIVNKKAYLILEKKIINWDDTLEAEYEDPYIYFYKKIEKGTTFKYKVIYDAWKKK